MYLCSKTHFEWRIWGAHVYVCSCLTYVERKRNTVLEINGEVCVSMVLIIYTVPILNLTFLYVPCSAMMYWFITKHIQNILPPRCVSVCDWFVQAWSYFWFILFPSSSHILSPTDKISFDVLMFYTLYCWCSLPSFPSFLLLLPKILKTAHARILFKNFYHLIMCQFLFQRTQHSTAKHSTAFSNTFNSEAPISI